MEAGATVLISRHVFSARFGEAQGQCHCESRSKTPAVRSLCEIENICKPGVECCVKVRFDNGPKGILKQGPAANLAPGRSLLPQLGHYSLRIQVLPSLIFCRQTFAASVRFSDDGELEEASLKLAPILIHTLKESSIQRFSRLQSPWGSGCRLHLSRSCEDSHSIRGK